MKLLVRIALAIAIVAGGSALFFANKVGGIKKDLGDQVASLTTEKAKLTKNLADVRTELGTTKQELTKSQEDLNNTKGELEAGKIALTTKTHEADSLKASLNSKTAELDQAKVDRDTAQQAVKKIQDSLAAAGIHDISNIDQLRDKIIAQTEETQILGKQLMTARADNAAMKQQIVDLTTIPSNLRGHVAAVQDNWGFVVLNLGRDQRVQTNTDFIVYRADKMVAKVQVRAVGENTSIAEILPGSQLSQPRVGDSAVH